MPFSNLLQTHPVETTNASVSSKVPLPFFTELEHDVGSRARRGVVNTERGAIHTPAFMPVGTQATVKTLDPVEIAQSGARVILCNTYHLMLRPGVEVLVEAGGLHHFMGWHGPILTDSGGFQVFSLASQARVSEDGVAFQSHIDGSPHMLTPELAIDLQHRWGSDIVMPLDHLVGLPATQRKVADAMHLTHRWLDRAIERHGDATGLIAKHSLFGICQGGVDLKLRETSADYIANASVAGCAIGGLSVGETKEEMASTLNAVTGRLPLEKPRYLMGVGSPEDLWNGVAQGIDLFDCVLPTRLARNGALFTPDGRIDIRSKTFRDLHRPIDETCDCQTCQRFTAAYLHHLFRAKEILGLRLATIHNLRFIAHQMEQMRYALEANCFGSARLQFTERYRPVGKSELSPADGQIAQG